MKGVPWRGDELVLTIAVPLNLYYCMPHNGDPWTIAVGINCQHLEIPGMVQAGMNIAADVTIFLLPLPVIAKLQIPLNKKIALGAIFATGLMYVLIRAVIRNLPLTQPKCPRRKYLDNILSCPD